MTWTQWQAGGYGHDRLNHAGLLIGPALRLHRRTRPVRRTVDPPAVGNRRSNSRTARACDDARITPVRLNPARDACVAQHFVGMRHHATTALTLTDGDDNCSVGSSSAAGSSSASLNRSK